MSGRYIKPDVEMKETNLQKFSKNTNVVPIIIGGTPKHKVTVLNHLELVKVDGKRYLQQAILYGPGGSQDHDEYTKWPNDGKALIGVVISSPLSAGPWIVVDGSVMTLTIRQPIGLLRSLWKRLCWYLYYPSCKTAMEIL